MFFGLKRKKNKSVSIYPIGCISRYNFLFLYPIGIVFSTILILLQQDDIINTKFLKGCFCNGRQRDSKRNRKNKRKK